MAMAAPDGFRYLPDFIDRTGQQLLLEEIRSIVAAAPLFQPVMPRTGKPFSVRMSNCGPLGWVSDRDGYRYENCHPETGALWPGIPGTLLELWKKVAPGHPEPEACLINYYGPGSKMGLHQDRDEQTFGAPVVSVSLGDTALFRIGGTKRTDPTRSFRLASGDVVVLGGDSRLAYHGIDRLVAGTSTLLKNGGRINLTLRRVT
ncbi:alpha-ketoglutarate-dependent dioxygenase AlkB [Roseibium sp. RKSG952]|uniref:alpha-ketoglutarate-dependent dioxygenase AlkB family protein n=1 Tax=Roseibium sp. RKSG952 TaxID=2529384 RepID=UPI0012BC12DA|nr:alpha-ketoglutarate-dependent dioxygenase AlkB [Roseibium sp. RKSG952]MTH99747.1 alpha-ketoglutarate-dependent dioxygenase AlkB [Roseibium sp. RKSG952]